MEISSNKFECKRDNLYIRGIEYRPKGDKLPIAIVSHGFLQNKHFVKRYAKFFAELGYAAFCFDFCGGTAVLGKSDGKTTDMSVLTEVKDLKSVIEYAKSLDYTDSNNITLMGCSLGGLVSALVANELEEDVKNLVLFYPAFFLPYAVREGQVLWFKFDPNNLPNKIMYGPISIGRPFAEDVMDMEPYELIPQYKGNVFIIHGTKDTTVDISYSDKAYDLYINNTKLNKKVIYHKIEGAGHRFFKKQDEIAYKALKEFLSDENL